MAVKRIEKWAIVVNGREVAPAGRPEEYLFEDEGAAARYAEAVGYANWEAKKAVFWVDGLQIAREM